MLQSFKFVLYILMVALLQPTIGQDKKPAENRIIAPPPKEDAVKKTAKGRYAFLVGINSYKSTASLKYAVSDSEKMEELFRKVGGFDKIVLLNDNGLTIKTANQSNKKQFEPSLVDKKLKPTRETIINTYQKLIDEKPEMLLFYYSGHGFIQGKDKENSIASYDISLKKDKDKLVAENGISLNDMAQRSEKVDQVVFLIDASRSPLTEDNSTTDTTEPHQNTKPESKQPAKDAKAQPIVEVANNRPVRTTGFTEDVLPDFVKNSKGIIMLIGAAPEAGSMEIDALESGVFTYYLFQGLSGGVQDENLMEYVTDETLSNYLQSKFNSHSADMEKIKQDVAEPSLYKITFNRGKAGELPIALNRPNDEVVIDRPYYFENSNMEQRISSRITYDKNGRRKDLRFLVRDKQKNQYYPDTISGIHRMTYNFVEGKDGELKQFQASQINLENEEIFQHGVTPVENTGWEYKGLYEPTKEDLASEERKKIRYQRQVFDYNGNNILQEYFDHKGKLLEIEEVARTVRGWDDNDELRFEAYYDEELKLVEKGGYARYAAAYKSKGNPVFEAWYTKNGKYGKNEYGVSRIDYVYDELNKLIQKNHFDADGKPIGDRWGVHSYSYTYSNSCLKFLEGRIPEKSNGKTKKELKKLFWESGYKNCISTEEHLDANKKPAEDGQRIYKTKRHFNEKGFLASEESYRKDGRRWIHSGIAKVVYTHDEEGNILTKTNYGELEVNKNLVVASDELGVHKYEYIYSAILPELKEHNLTNECLAVRREAGAFPKSFDCARVIQHYGIDGKPIENIDGVFKTVIYYSGAYQVEADRHYYSLDNVYLKRDSKGDSISFYNPVGKQTLQANYETIDGKEILEWKTLKEYNNKGNKILFAHYEGKEGKEVLVGKNVYEYGDKNNLTQDLKYEIKDGKEYLVGKQVFTHNDKNNLVSKASYTLKDGKEIFVTKYVYTYDTKENIASSSYYKSVNGKEALVRKYTYEYNDKANLLQESRFDIMEGKEVLVGKYVYGYDAKGNKISEVSLSVKDGKEYQDWKKINSHDEKGNRVQYAYYETQDGKESLTWKETYSYDDKGHLISGIAHAVNDGNETLAWKKINEYNDKGNITLYAYYESIGGKETLLGKIVLDYSPKGDLIAIARYRTQNEKENLVERYTFDNPFSIAVQTRETEISEMEKELENEKEEVVKKEWSRKLEDKRKELETKKKKYMLTTEKYDSEGTYLEQEYNLVFRNHQGPFDKRYLKVTLDRFYRPVKTKFMEE